MGSKKPSLPAEVFLSYANKDQSFANELAAMLRGHGLPVWYSSTNILGAQQWHDEIGHALSRCDWFLLLMSPHAVKSKWVKRELLYALRHDRYEERIVPIRYKACDESDLSWVLPTLQSVDFCVSYEAGCRALLRVWGLGLKKTKKA